MMTTDDAVAYLRSNERYAELVRDAYFDADTLSAAQRYEQSAEFQEVLRLLGKRVVGAQIADLGAGAGIAAYGFAKHGAKVVHAIEPDPSDQLGQGAIRRLSRGLPIEIVTGFGENLPLLSDSVDIVFARQVLHHTRDLDQVLRECYRTLRNDGLFLGCREHVVDDSRQLETFLINHPVHALTGTENAFPLAQYLSAIRNAGFQILQTFGPWDSIINAFPLVRNSDELRNGAKLALRRRLGVVGTLAGKIPGVESFVWRRLRRPLPGRMFTFLAQKA